MLCSDNDELHSQIGFNLSNNEDKKKLMLQVQNKFKSKDSFTPNRLIELLNQSIYYQVINNKFHNPNAIKEFPSLFKDYNTELKNPPTVCFQTLRDHTDEVWQIKFSNDGRRLVSYASNSTVIMWKWNNDKNEFSLNWKANNSHRKEINCICWSPDDKKLLTCSSDQSIKLWESENGELVQHIKDAHKDIINAVLFTNDGQGFISGSIDNFLTVWDLEGNKRYEIKSTRISDLLLPRDPTNNNLFVISGSSNRVLMINLDLRNEMDQLNETDNIISACINYSGKLL